jgi:hypothetical protein
MNIMDSSPAYISLRELAARAGCPETTIRHAVRKGALPRRYAANPHGPQLVFLPAEVECWLATRTAYPERGRRSVRSPRMPDAHTADARERHAVASLD